MDWESHTLRRKPPPENNPPLEAFFIQNKKKSPIGKNHWLRKKPFGLAILLILSFSFSIFLTFAYPPSVAYTQHTFFLPVVLKSPYITLTLAWDQNSEPDLAGYKLYIRKSSLKDHKVIDLGLTTRYTISIFMDGAPFFFTITAYNQKGLESGFSNEVQYP